MIAPSPRALARSVRARIEREIDRLITLLDKIDADPDLEPYLGWPEDGPDHLASDLCHDDREEEEEDEHGGDVQDEPHDEAEEGNNEAELDL